MSIDLSKLTTANRILFEIPLRPVQGARFQPTGFPSLGAATYQTKDGSHLLVESAQSMANRLERVCWDDEINAPVNSLSGISHVTVTRKGAFLTDTMLEAHRLNSPYLVANKSGKFFTELKAELGELEQGPVDRKKLAQVLLKYDVGSLLHGVFLEKVAGRLRVARAISAFIEASGVRVAASGGVKNDHVNPSGVAKEGFGNVPFARDEFTAESIKCFVNIDLAQIRGYGLGDDATRLLTLLALHRLRRLLSGDLRLRSACDLELVEKDVVDHRTGFVLPPLDALEAALPSAIQKCGEMKATTATFDGELKKGSDAAESDADGDEESSSED